MRPTRLLLLFLLILISAHAVADGGVVLSSSFAGISVAVSPSGKYTVSVLDPAWTFSGDVGHPLSGLSTTTGSDNIGSYQETSFSYDDGGARQASIRAYADKPVVLFTIRYVTVAGNTTRFPTLVSYPQGLYHLSYSGVFGNYHFDQYGSDSPWLFFDDAANAFLLSPASNFMVAATNLFGAQIAGGIDSRIPDLPAGFTHRTMLVVAKGINRTFEIWGKAMTDLQGKTRPANDADLSLSSLGYWTDAGADYYYSFDPNRGYAGTLLAVRDDFAKQRIPLGYMQLDSWFYPKGPKAEWNNSGGIYQYAADVSLFPKGLKAFQQQLGLPLLTHARWIDSASPYRQQYQISGNVATDPRYWSDIFRYLRDAGTAIYEQDWLGQGAETAFNLRDPDAFMDNMAKAAAENGLTMQYSMPLPAHYLQSSKYSNATTIRTSGDRCERVKWTQFLYGARLASALGVWPWVDVFNSSETDNALLATLSAGIVGVGDPIGSLNRDNLMRVVRGDAVIVKPDVALVPLDDVFIRDARQEKAPMVASAYTDFGGSRASYVFAYDHYRGGSLTVAFQPQSLGFSGPVYIYNYFSGSGAVVNAGDTFSEPMAGGHAYYIVVPIGVSGIAFLGDTGHFVSLGKKRISQLQDSGALKATVLFVAGENFRTLRGYSPTPPVVNMAKGSAGALTFDAATRLFSVPVSPDAGGSAVISLEPSAVEAGAMAAPAIAQGGVVNAATYSAPVAPGGIASVFGLQLAGSSMGAAGSGLPNSLGGVQVSIAGLPAPQFFASPTQINVQIPWETPLGDSVGVKVVRNGHAGNSASLSVVPFAPGIFTLPGIDPRQGAVLISGAGLVAASDAVPGARPARRGEYISVYCTGLGPVDRTPATGMPAPAAPLSNTLNKVDVNIGGVKGEVGFAGLAPGGVGLYQVDVRVPLNIPVTGDQIPLSLAVGGITSNTVTIAVRASVSPDLLPVPGGPPPIQ